MADFYEMRDGSTTTDPRLGRLRQFDEASRSFSYASAAPALRWATKVWPVPVALNQLSDGTCVGHGFEHEAGALPVATLYSHDHALVWFDWAALHDQWPNTNSRADGTSVLCGAKYGVLAGYFSEYRWCFSRDEVKSAVANEGPVVVGTDWLDRMFDPDFDGRLHVEGAVAGGHCWLIFGLILAGDINPLTGQPAPEDVYLMQNSWGPTWGIGGRAWLTVADFEILRLSRGEVCVPMGRKDPTRTPPAPPKPKYKKKWVWNRFRGWIQVFVRAMKPS